MIKVVDRGQVLVGSNGIENIDSVQKQYGKPQTSDLDTHIRVGSVKMFASTPRLGLAKLEPRMRLRDTFFAMSLDKVVAHDLIPMYHAVVVRG